MFTDEQIQEIENASLPDALKLVAEQYPDETVFSTSLGQEDQVLTEVIATHKLPVKIFTLDTGRLFYEHYELLERTNARYKTNIQVYFPEAADVEAYVAAKGINGFYESVENRKECCFIRKVKPLNRALEGAKVWITGLRSEQSENRKDMKMIEWDDDRKLYKFNPLIHWSYDEMTGYIQQKNIPYNPLHDKGFISIGCAPCTRAIEPGENPRAGRWWWEISHKECGLHVHQ
ncbi:phosphoadenosine phosphosulfate reductase [Niabella ginsenosidivorans]|uniref:Adenosine 5'-phosphosulfate reductase n=1 Tax=Niabella ginsenosidivorans TaxID=1176587 RepID=A0A1A9I800_9BACT|nr:phosphoadenylyl-sulfate reductase [Niabella ginsenosidivorans]ANH82792.1 phosphoadenosine phosphosulfate reductase [Niabella ginsenosidivorans]